MCPWQQYSVECQDSAGRCASGNMDANDAKRKGRLLYFNLQDIHIQGILGLFKKLVDVLFVVVQGSFPNLLSLFQGKKLIGNFSQSSVIADHFHSHTLHLTICQNRRLRSIFCVSWNPWFELFANKNWEFTALSCEFPILAGAQGLEPWAYGFGDRRSTNWAIPLYV